jgi:hypothetical protein
MPRTVFYTPIKRSHLVAPFGVGALLLSRNGVGIIVCGLDEWLHGRPSERGGATWLEKSQIVDAHLERRLGVSRLIQAPAVADDPDDRNTWFVRVARFPLSEYCINPKCRRVVTRAPEAVSQGLCDACQPAPGSRRSWPTQQVPLVLACPAGHLSDIPWVEWVHAPELQARDVEGIPHHPGGMCSKPTITYRVATDITAPVVECETCKAGIDLGALRNRRYPCTGGRPWLPGTAAEACETDAVVLERTATSLYYPWVRSALHLPHGPHVDHRLMAFLAEPAARLILDDYSLGERPTDRDLDRLARVAAGKGIATTADEIVRHLDVASAPAEDVDDRVVRARELQALLDATPKTSSQTGLPPLITSPRSIDDYSGEWFTGSRRRFSLLTAVPRLAETRALVGFSRVEPGRPTPAEGFVQQWGAPLDAARERDWLVAHRVYGEGFLLLFDPDAVREWEAAVNTSAAAFRNPSELGADILVARHLLAHTFSHVLLRETASVCGYALPSLRERIYVTADDDGTEHTGVLIYTAEGDSYGTLGGLVELAEPGNLENLVAAAVDRARWCGADPVCMHPPVGVGLSTTPGCCHHCLLVPETTCEWFNTWLDRGALVGGRDGAPPFFG